MAIPIKPVPILTGEIAEYFIMKAEENQHKPRKNVSPKQRAIVREMERQLREFTPSWKR